MVNIVPIEKYQAFSLPAGARGAARPVLSAIRPSLTHELIVGDMTAHAAITDDLRLSGEMFAAIAEKAMAHSGAVSLPRELSVSTGQCDDRLSVMSGKDRIVVNEKVLDIKDDDIIRNILVQLSVFHALSGMNGRTAANAHEADAGFIALWMEEYLVGINELELKLGAAGISCSPLVDALRSMAENEASVPVDPKLEERLAPVGHQFIRSGG